MPLKIILEIPILGLKQCRVIDTLKSDEGHIAAKETVKTWYKLCENRQSKSCRNQTRISHE